MSNETSIRVKELDSVNQGKGYYSGILREDHKVFTYLQKQAVVLVTSSTSAVFRAIDDLKWKPEREKASNKTRSEDKGFYHFEDLKSAVGTYVENPRSVRIFKEEDLKIAAEDSIGKDVTFDIVGDYVDVGRFLDGEPECFGVAYNGNPSNLTARIIINLSFPWNVSDELINYRSSRILRLVDWMEAQGVRCEIRGVESTECAHIDVGVKQLEDAVDMNALAVTTHSDFLRRISFLIAEQSATWAYGYGSPRLFTSSMMKNYRADPADGLTVFITQMSSSVDEEQIDREFDKLRDKVIELLVNKQSHDFSKVYCVDFS